MKSKNEITKTCPSGHVYKKSSDCPVCPRCENERIPNDNFLEFLSAPARRALENHGVFSILELSNYSEAEIFELHGIGNRALIVLRNLLSENQLTFKETNEN